MNIDEFQIYIKDRYITISNKEKLKSLKEKLKSIKGLDIEDRQANTLADYLGYEPEPIENVLIRKYFARYGYDLYSIINLGRIAFQFSKEELHSVIFFTKDFTDKDKQFNKIVIDHKIKNLYITLSEMSILTTNSSRSMSFDNFTFFNELSNLNRLKIYITKEV